MSIEALNWATEVCVTPTQKLLLLVLANCANGNGIAYPSNAFLVKITGLCDKTIRTTKKQLLEKNILIKEPWMRIYDVKLNLQEKFPKTVKDSSNTVTVTAKEERVTVFTENENNNTSAVTVTANAVTRSVDSVTVTAVPEPSRTIKNRNSITPYNPPQENSPLETNQKSNPKIKTPKPKIELPEWLPLDAWQGWLEMRAKKKVPTTDRAKKRSIKKLAKFFDLGYDIGEILDTSTDRGWTDVYEPKQKSDISFSKPHVFKNKKPKYNPFDEFVENEYQPDNKIITDVEYQELVQQNLIEG